MAYQNTFKRYELKYLLTETQKRIIMDAMQAYMALDKYGRTVIRNLYFDTTSFRLIRHSMEKPVYKEKLRIRSYGVIPEDGQCFVELKKKYDHIVYKRRLTMPQNDALRWLAGDHSLTPGCQIGQEIEYFRDYYGSLHPTVFLSYARQAWYSFDGSDFRVTFDNEILCRQDGLSLCNEPAGSPLLPEDMTLMEIKTSGGIPLWMTHLLTQNHIYKTSYSKYGTAYEGLIFPQLQGVNRNETVSRNF
ncbi:MAG: polyphosphate polymerase domain-containing protein [Oscillospiraceae bacterium]|nr:polyphosphate polymerase domain-containing protein [Oscillospiraceae bacterium]